MQVDDGLLLERWARHRDAEAFRELVGRYAPMVYAVSRRVLRSTDQAEDASQECFLQLSRAPRGAKLHLPAWLHRVATNKALSILRREKRRRRAELGSRETGQTRQEAEWDDVQRHVDQAIERLPEKLRLPVVAHFLEGRTHESIARDLGVSRETVTYRIRLGIDSIRSFLKKRGYAVAPAALASWMSERMAEAAPESLVASLGRMALAGLRTPRGMAASGHFTAKAAILLGLILVAACGVLVFVRWPREAKRVGAVASAPASQPSRSPLAPMEAPLAAPAAAPAASGAAQPAAGSDAETAGGELASATLQGTVVDEADAPVAGAGVYLLVFPETEKGVLSLDPDRIQRSRWLETRSGADGRFELHDIQLKGDALPGASRDGLQGVGRMLEIEPGKSIEGVTITLSPLPTVAGIVVAADGSPVSDAVVSVAYSWNRAKVFEGGWSSITDGLGRFLVGVVPKTEHLTLRVTSQSRGQAFFNHVSADDKAIRLVMEKPARLRGRITWDDGSPGEGVIVCAVGEVPGPEILQRPTFGVSQHKKEARVGADGELEIDGLSPGLAYEVYVVAPSPDASRASPLLLTPRDPEERHTFAAGEVKTWDRTLARLIAVTGEVRTERAKTPVPGVRIALRKDGKRVRSVRGETFLCETDVKGRFRFQLPASPGSYEIFAQPREGPDRLGDLIAERFSKAITLQSSGKVEVDLEIYEPVVLPVRVLDAAGFPPERISARFSFRLEHVERFAWETSAGLDAKGRASFHFFFPSAELSLKVRDGDKGPELETGNLKGECGTVLPEITLRLPRA